MSDRTELDYAISNVYSEVRLIIEKTELIYESQRKWKRAHKLERLISFITHTPIPYDDELDYWRTEITRLNTLGGQMVARREIERKLLELKRTG